MSTVLVAYASRMGSTREIAAAIADELAQLDHTVTVASCAEASDVDGFDAVVIGSAIYVRRWLPDAVHYLRSQSPYLTSRPTYLFHSGPCDTTTGVNGTSSQWAVRRFGLSEPVLSPAGSTRPVATGRLARWVATGSTAGGSAIGTPSATGPTPSAPTSRPTSTPLSPTAGRPTPFPVQQLLHQGHPT
jgi:menaquinone-dependent protoporphyrinogen oxidase